MRSMLATEGKGGVRGYVGRGGGTRHRAWAPGALDPRPRGVWLRTSFTADTKNAQNRVRVCRFARGDGPGRGARPRPVHCRPLSLNQKRPSSSMQALKCKRPPREPQTPPRGPKTPQRRPKTPPRGPKRPLGLSWEPFWTRFGLNFGPRTSRKLVVFPRFL